MLAMSGELVTHVNPRRWSVPALAVFAKHGMFSDADKDELIRRRPETNRVDLDGGSHDAHRQQARSAQGRSGWAVQHQDQRPVADLLRVDPRRTRGGGDR